MQQANHGYRIGRRAFLKGGALILAASAALPRSVLFAGEEKPQLRVGLVTDLHYADREPRGSRHYRDGLAKLARAGEQFAKDKPDLVVELGDLIDDSGSADADKACLRRISRDLAAMSNQHHCVLGNHCVEILSKGEFLDIVGQKASFYSFDAGGHHFVILDACFRHDGEPYGRKNFQWSDANIPPQEVEWLRDDLAKTSLKTIVMVHQRLDAKPPYGVKNAPDVRALLEKSGKVLAVLQGHEHKGDYQEIQGIHYCTLHALVEGAGVENNAFALLDILPGDAIRITGFCKQPGYKWP